MAQQYPSASLLELLNDPIARLLMERDGVNPMDVRHLMATMRRALAARAAACRHDAVHKPLLAA